MGVPLAYYTSYLEVCCRRRAAESLRIVHDPAERSALAFFAGRAPPSDLWDNVIEAPAANFSLFSAAASCVPSWVMHRI